MTTIAEPAVGPAAAEAVIVDYNGVIGLQPTRAMWQHLTTVAGWPTDQAAYLQAVFWNARDAYDEGALTDREFWTAVLGTEPTPDHLHRLVAADTAMWTRTDHHVLAALHHVHRAGLPVVLLSNAPHPLADALDTSSWRRTLLTDAVYSARIGRRKPDPDAYTQALTATQVPPERVLFVDDRLDNCHTARELGMRALHFTGDIAHLTSTFQEVHAAR